MSCLETYATLRIFSASLPPGEISQILGIQASKSTPIDPDSRYRNRREFHLWRLSSSTPLASSTDGLEHIRYVTNTLAGKENALDLLRGRGCDIDIVCCWVSDGQGGPALDARTLMDLARLKLDIWWDVYFADPIE